MSEWQDLTWGDIATLEYGKALRDYKEENGIFPVYGANGPIGWANRALHDEPGVIVGRKGAYRGVHFSNRPFFVIDTAFYLNPIRSLNIKWAYYQLLTLDINGMDSGSAIPSTSRDEFYQLPVSVPSEQEQSEIAEILCSLDNKIALNRKLNATLEEMARALFQSWFVDFDPVKAKLAAKRNGRDPEKACMAALSGKLRIAPGKPTAERLADQLPTAEELDAAIAALDTLTEAQRQQLDQTAACFPGNFHDSGLGLIPSGWRDVALYDTADFVNGAAFKFDEFADENGAVPIIKIAELKQGITDQTKFTRKDVKERHRIHNGDLLYSWSGSPGTSLEVFKWFGGPGWLNQHIFKINTVDEKQNIFVWLLLKHLKPELIRIAENKQTTGLGHVTVADMKRLCIAYPDDACLRAFGELVQPLYEQHSYNIVQASSLASLRDALMPKLLSGEISVTTPERS
jgi:type I restriction enzyme S subunit